MSTTGKCALQARAPQWHRGPERGPGMTSAQGPGGQGGKGEPANTDPLSSAIPRGRGSRGLPEAASRATRQKTSESSGIANDPRCWSVASSAWRRPTARKAEPAGAGVCRAGSMSGAGERRGAAKREAVSGGPGPWAGTRRGATGTSVPHGVAGARGGGDAGSPHSGSSTMGDAQS
jgi:hypothetical protein